MLQSIILYMKLLLLCIFTGLVIYPGKLSETDCFRLGNIGDLHIADMQQLLTCIEESCQEMGVALPIS